MFGFGKRSGTEEMKKLLVGIQGVLSLDGLGQEMRMYQHAFVEKTRTFIEYSENFESEGMTVAGGLAKYCHNALNKTIGPVNEGLPPMPLIIDLGEKMAYVALSINRYVSEDDLTNKDKIMINNAIRAANEWLVNEHRNDLLVRVQERLDEIESNIKNDGIFNAMKNSDTHVSALTAW